jgi:hypothetical protein
MRKAIKYLLALFFVTLSYSSCKKYPDGPLLNFTSKEKRIERTWTLEYLEIGGIDSTSYFLDENDSGFKFNFLKLKLGRDASYVDYGSNRNLYRFVYVNCYLIDNKKKLSIDRQNYDPSVYSLKDQVGPFWVNDKVEFRIRKLTKEELWLETTYNGNLTKVHFREK